MDGLRSLPCRGTFMAKHADAAAAPSAPTEEGARARAGGQQPGGSRRVRWEVVVGDGAQQQLLLTNEPDGVLLRQLRGLTAARTADGGAGASAGPAASRAGGEKPPDDERERKRSRGAAA